MHNLEERYRSHTSDLISNKQTEVLRANKVLREVARGLGADWRFVFKYLMAGRPKEVIDIEMEKLERVKPFMQVRTCDGTITYLHGQFKIHKQHSIAWDNKSYSLIAK